jgi:hypothetical protein
MLKLYNHSSLTVMAFSSLDFFIQEKQLMEGPQPRLYCLPGGAGFGMLALAFGLLGAAPGLFRRSGCSRSSRSSSCCLRRRETVRGSKGEPLVGRQAVEQYDAASGVQAEGRVAVS